MSDNNQNTSLEDLAGITASENVEEDTSSKAITLNSDEKLTALKQEVVDEFETSDSEVYKEGLRSILEQEQQLKKQIRIIENEIRELHSARSALDEAFKSGELKSVEDARGITRTVREKRTMRNVDRSF